MIIDACLALVQRVEMPGLVVSGGSNLALAHSVPMTVASITDNTGYQEESL